MTKLQTKNPLDSQSSAVEVTRSSDGPKVSCVAHGADTFLASIIDRLD